MYNRRANEYDMRKTSIKDLGKKWFAFSKLEDFKPEELVARIYE